IAKRMEFVTKQARLILPYGMLLTRLFKYVMGESSELFNESCVLYDRVMYPLTAQQERKTQKDYDTRRASSLFESKPQSLPPTSNDTPSLQPSNTFLDNIMDAPPRPSHPTPIQSYPSLDITLSLSPISPLDHILETPSPPSPPQPQPPIMGHPLYYNYHDYHGSTCICCSHNQNLFLTLRDEMNIMFAHLEYLLTTAITSHFPPQP
ncbi:hypothetical protein Tco_0846665, partial [Tanacetum coccineum]